MQTDSPIEIRKFDPARHVRAGFECGVARLDNYLLRSAKKHQKGDMTRVFVAVEPERTQVLGYHAINMGSMDVRAMPVPPKDVPSHGHLPVLFLGQIAVDRRFARAGIGSILMYHVWAKAVQVADEVGCFAVLLDVMADGGRQAFEKRRAWYAEFGFQPMASDPARMFMTMKSVRAALARQLAEAD